MKGFYSMLRCWNFILEGKGHSGSFVKERLERSWKTGCKAIIVT
jgi:hypothetical protein